MSPATAELEALLSSLFEAEELRRFLRRLPHGEALVATLPGEGCSKADLVHKTRLALERRGMVDEDIFAALRVEFPKRLADIDAVAARRAPAAPHARPRGPDQAPDRAGGVHIHGGTFHNVQILQGEHGRQEQRVEARAAPPESSSWRSRGEVARRAGGGPLPTWDPVRILHLSDLHFHEKTQWDAGTVLGALAEDVKILQASVGPIDLVVLTGDLAFAGKAEEYTLAETWLTEKLAPAAGVSKDRIRMVPGNHDVDRKQISRMVRASDADMVATGEDAIAEILADAPQRAQILARQSAYRAFAARFHPGLNAPWWTHTLPLRDLTLRLIGLNTAWLAGSHLDPDNRVQDQRHLLIGGPQWNALFASADPADLCIALMHHPWDDLVERDQRALEEATLTRCGVVLRGHLHDAKALATQADDLDVLQLAAGACYADPRDGWPHGYQLLELDPRLGQARIHLRKWHGRERTWIPDKERYRKAAPEGILTRPLRRSPRFPASRPLVPEDRDDEPTDPGSRPAPRPTPRQRYAAQLKARADVLAQVFRTRDGPSALSQVYVEVKLAAERGVMEALEEPAPASPSAWSSLFGTARRWYASWLGGGKGADGRACAVPSGPFKLENVATMPSARWAVLGDPGGGKTTLLRHTALHLVEETQHLPVLLKVSELKDSLLASVTESYGAEAASLVKAALADKTAVVLLDGLDEATDKAASRRAVQRLAAELGPTPLVLASRPIGFEAPTADFVELALCPLGKDEQRRLLEAWVTDAARVTRALSRLDSSPRLRRLAENPLLLTLVGLLLREDKDIPSRRGELYDSAVQILLTRAADPVRAQRRLREPALAREALAWAALKLHGRAEEVYRTADLVSVLQDHDRHSRNCREIWGGPSGFLTEVAETTGLLVPTTASAEGAPAFAFPHRTFREHLAAVALERDIGIHGIGDISAEILQGAAREDRALDIPPASGELGRVLVEAKARPETWSEVLALVCALLGKGTGDALVRRVAAEGKAALVQRVVAEAEGLSPDTVLAVLGLERGWDKWQDRQKILQDLPALAGDRGLAVRLLDRYRRETTDGNDLFWIRATLTAIAEDPKADLESKREAEEARDRLFEHMQERRAEAVGLLKELWKPIPAGSFRMGSPDGEGYDDEHPQHEVTFKTGFQMMSVPVTWRLYELFDPGHKEARRSFNGLPKDQHAEAPVYNVTWFASTMFAAWVGARLPLEAEWEYACRAKTTTPYWRGATEADLARVGWYDKNSDYRPHKVAELPANPWGLHDMHGNVWEWCLDVWDSDAYAARRGGVTVDPAVIVGLGGASSADAAGRGRVQRGGAWSGTPGGARSANRGRGGPADTWYVVGFRLVRPVVVSEPGG